MSIAFAVGGSASRVLPVPRHRVHGCPDGVYPTAQKCHETAGFDPAGRVSLRRRRCHAGWCSNWQMCLVEVPPVRAAVPVSRRGASWYCSAGGLSWLSWSLVQVVPPGVFGPLWTRDVNVWVWAGWRLDDDFNLRLRRGGAAGLLRVGRSLRWVVVCRAGGIAVRCCRWRR